MTRSFETRNVMLWLGNDKELYEAMRHFATRALNVNYRDFIWGMKLETGKTPDGVAWVSDALDYEDLDAFIIEIGQV